jgi:hypothetical protein
MHMKLSGGLQKRLKVIDESVAESCMLPITDEAIQSIPAIAHLCHLFQRIIDYNELEKSQYSKMSYGAKMTIDRDDFTSILKTM